MSNAKELKKIILARFRAYNMNPTLRVVGAWVDVGTSKYNFMIRFDTGFVYRMTYSTGITGSNVTGTMDTLVRFILKQFGVSAYTGTISRLSTLDKRSVKNLIAAGMVTEQYLTNAILKEHEANVRASLKHAKEQGKRLGLCTAGY
jgi:hypothetical protein